MSKVTKKQLQQKIDRQETRIDRLVGMLAKKGFYDKFKNLDQSIFDDEPPHLKWAAIEEDGSVYLFAKKPFIDLHKWAAGVDETEVYIGNEYDASNWQDSLIERDIAKELTGSELCKAMLARGDLMVVVWSGRSDDDARLQAKNADSVDPAINIVSHFNGGYFYDVWGSGHKGAVPISLSTGLELTTMEPKP